jgi:hypothetical protein
MKRADTARRTVSASTTRTSSRPAIFSDELFDAELAVATAASRTVRRTLDFTFGFVTGRFAAFAGFGVVRRRVGVGVTTTGAGVTTTGVYDLTGA